LLQSRACPNLNLKRAPDTTSTTSPEHRAGIFGGFFLWALSLFLLGLGMKLLMLQRCVNPVPYFDQWEGEAAAIYIPYFEHALSLADLLHPQNEHRIFLTHVYDLALLWLNGQWDSQLQMVLNAVIHCATVAGFGVLLAALMGRRHFILIWISLAVALLSPFGWENALCGFQSQFYFLLLFSLLTLWLLGSEPATRRWRLGVLAAILALLSMASGLLAAAAVASVTLLDILKHRDNFRRLLPTLVACALMVIAGLLLKGKAAGEEKWHAQSVHAFLLALGNNLSWPTGLLPWLAPLNLLPLAVLGWVYLRSKEDQLAAERLILAVGFWAVLQSVATAYARGFEGRPPYWRYMDTLCFLFTANFLGAALLLGKHRQMLRFAPAWRVAFALWLLPCIGSLWTLNRRAWEVAIPTWAHSQQIRMETTRAFVATDDVTVFANHAESDLAWFYLPELEFLLRSPDIRPILPACVREPLKLSPKDNTPSAFTTNGCPPASNGLPGETCLGSYPEAGPGKRGTFESAPMRSRLPYLEISVAGGLGNDPGLTLDLVELASGKVTPVRPASASAEQWRDVYVKAPAAEFKLVAREDSAKGWFAFKAPREMGRCSYWAMRAVGCGTFALLAGFLSLAAAVAFHRPDATHPSSRTR
jgi:hypothetical protein